MQETDFPLGDYFKLVGIPENLSLKPSVETLYFVVNKHATHIPYQNIHFHHKERRTVDLSLQAIKEKLINKAEGGMCFETSELMFHALTHMGFKVIRVPGWTLNNLEHNPLMPPIHNVLIAKIDGRQFLIDIGFGYNGMRYPMEFNFEKTQELALTPYEKYQLICNEDHYIVCMWIKEEWFKLYRFDRPIKVIDNLVTAENYKSLFESPLEILIRDKYIKIGKMTDEGRIGFHYEPRVRPFLAFRMDTKKDKVTKTEINDYKTLQENLKDTLGLTLPDQDMLKLDD